MHLLLAIYYMNSHIMIGLDLVITIKAIMTLVKPYFLNDDLTLANMEVPIGGNELGVSGNRL